MSALLEAETEETTDADLTPERQLELIKSNQSQINSLYELVNSLQARVESLEAEKK